MFRLGNARRTTRNTLSRTWDEKAISVANTVLRLTGLTYVSVHAKIAFPVVCEPTRYFFLYLKRQRLPLSSEVEYERRDL